MPTVIARAQPYSSLRLFCSSECCLLQSTYDRHSGGNSDDNDDALMITGASLRLVASSLPREGRLEIYHNGEWGTVCDDYFGRTEASVACDHLGLG